MTGALINTQLTIIIYLIIGFVLYKTKIFTAHAQVFVSDMTVGVLLPTSVFISFVKNMSLDLLTSLALILATAIVIETVLYLLTKIKWSWFSPSESAVLHYGMLVSNGGLIGTPVIEALFGSVGVVCCNVFLIPTRIMAYSAGESIFNPSLKRSFKEIVHALITNRIIIAMAIGLVFVLFGIKLEGPAYTALANIAACLGPFSLMLVGSMLAEKITITKDMIEKITVVCLIRLFAIPLVVLGLCVLLHFDFMTTAIIVLLMGMPVGSTCASFSKRYKGNEPFASSAVLVSTLLSTITLVILMSVMETIFTIL